jgi:hypothetical protein
VSLRHGDDITAVLYLLFFDEDDSNLRYIPRGVPAAVSRRATRFDIPMASARRALEIISEDEDAQALVRTIPRRSVLRAMDAARRALNLGVAEAGMTAGIVTQEGGLRFPLWEIREQMDSRTRGNPTGMYPLGGHHWQVSGYINTMAEIVRQDCVPPCGMNCRAGLHPGLAAQGRDARARRRRGKRRSRRRPRLQRRQAGLHRQGPVPRSRFSVMLE